MSDNGRLICDRCAGLAELLDTCENKGMYWHVHCAAARAALAERSES